MDYPKLRHVNIFQTEMAGRKLICLQDPQSISEKSLFLPLPLYFVVSLCDGQHSFLDIQSEYMRRFGEFLFTDKLEEIIRQLDENLFLEGERFQEVLQQVEERFRKCPVREAAFAGKSYESDPERLRSQLEPYFREPEGTPGSGGEADSLKGVVAPHIDFQRGGGCYGFAHREIGLRNFSRCFIIFGIAHGEMKQAFCLTRKRFLTPLGGLDADQELIEALQSRCSYDLFQDESAHRSEHSIEFQCVFLRYLYPEPAAIRIVPVLCGSLHEAISKGVSPMELKPFREFIEALKESVSSLRREVCAIASADLAHMGLQFGDLRGMNDYDLRILEGEDRDMLGYVERRDGEGFFQSILREKDRRKVCGLPAIYAMLHSLEAKEGRLLNYGQAYTPETQSVVSFASLAFY